MKDRKREFKYFKYRECDTFAEYLTQQSENGWHFKEWKMGLVFEKGIPESIHYSVEVFPKGAEMDTRPESDAKEYAEYCEAAGWKFIDSHRKFCIFRREREDAVPIVTSEERFLNIKEAEWHRGLSNLCGTLLIPVPYLYKFFVSDFASLIFNDIMLVILLMMLLAVLNAGINCLRILAWSVKSKWQLHSGVVPRYGIRKSGILYWRLLYILLLSIGYVRMIYLVYHEGFQSIMMPWVVIVGFVLLMYYVVIPILRPSRSENWLLQIGIGFIVMIMFAIFFVMIDDLGEDQDWEQNVPLKLSDYTESTGEPDYADIGRLDGILGKYLYYFAEYIQEEAVTPEDSSRDFVRYEIYQTKYPWILKKIWREKAKELTIDKANVDEWNAVSVCQSTEESYSGVRYSILYENSVLVLQSGKKLDEAQIRIICEKLNLE